MLTWDLYQDNNRYDVLLCGLFLEIMTSVMVGVSRGARGCLCTPLFSTISSPRHQFEFSVSIYFIKYWQWVLGSLVHGTSNGIVKYLYTM